MDSYAAASEQLITVSGHEEESKLSVRLVWTREPSVRTQEENQSFYESCLDMASSYLDT
jgi:hypothetical protein